MDHTRGLDATADARVGTVEHGCLRLHHRLLADRGRTTSFIAAIADVVRKGDIVLDIGTGTGILALAAARAGADHVYAVERGDMAAVAERMIAANRLSTQITVVPSDSRETHLPRLADVLIAELIGDTPFAEDIVPVVVDAKKRLLRNNARIIPQALRMFAVPVSLSEPMFNALHITDDVIAEWAGWYGFRFDAVRDSSERSFRTNVPPMMRPQMTWLGEPVLVRDITLSDVTSDSFADIATCTATSDGIHHGFILYFEAQLTAHRMISTSPRSSGPDNHWHLPLILRDRPRPTRIGDSMSLLYCYDQSRAVETVAITR